MVETVISVTIMATVVVVVVAIISDACGSYDDNDDNPGATASQL